MSIADFNFDIFGKKNGPERQFFQWLHQELGDVHEDVEEIKNTQAQMRTDLQVHLAVQKEQWKGGCYPKWLKPSIVVALLLSAGNTIYHWLWWK